MTAGMRRGYEPEFEAWWADYPRKDGSKSRAAELFAIARRAGISCELLTEKVQSMRRHVEAKRQAGVQTEYPHADTWLNQRRWECNYTPAAKLPWTRYAV